MVRLDLINTFWYEGIIVDYRGAEAHISDEGRLYTPRYIIIQNDIDGKRQSRIKMLLPKSFSEKRIRLMMRNLVPARFHFCIYYNNTQKGGVNTILCMSIEPQDKRYEQGRQELVFDAYKMRRNRAPIVDAGGYSFPYDY